MSAGCCPTYFVKSGTPSALNASLLACVACIDGGVPFNHLKTIMIATRTQTHINTCVTTVFRSFEIFFWEDSTEERVVAVLEASVLSGITFHAAVEPNIALQ